MIATHIRFHFNSSDFEALRNSAELHIPHILSNHRLEILSRAAGFESLEGIRSSSEIQTGREIVLDTNLDAAVQYANQIGYTFEVRYFYEILSSAIMPKVASAYPLLHDKGYGKSSLYPNREEIDQIQSNTGSDDYNEKIRSIVQSRFSEGRENLFKIIRRPQLLHALAMVSCAEPTKNTNTKRSSSGLKSLVENITFSLPYNVTLQAGPVTETDMIAAALYYGFKISADTNSRYYTTSKYPPTFNMSERSMKSLAKESIKKINPQSDD